MLGEWGWLFCRGGVGGMGVAITYNFRYVFAAKIDVKCCKLAYQCALGRTFS